MASASNTTEQVGLITSSRKATSAGVSIIGKPNSSGSIAMPAIGKWAAIGVGDRLDQIVIDAAPKAHRMNDRGKIVGDKDKISGLAGDIGSALADRDADMRGLQRRRVVDAIAGHRDDIAGTAERIDDPQLLRRGDAGKHINLAD